MKNKKLIRKIFELCIILCIALSSWLFSIHSKVPIPSTDTPALFYSTDRDDHLGTLFKEAIANAKTSIQIAIYTLTDQRILQALRQKASLGVKVTVICDAKACQGIEKKLGNDIHLIKSTPKGLMHLKILVIDDRLVWVGSANMTGESLRVHGNIMTGFDSPELAVWIQKKLFSLSRGSSEYTPPNAFLIGNQTIEFWFLPNDKDAVQRIRQLIRSAKKTIQIAMFTWTRLDFVNDIVSAKLRGVDVQIVLDTNSSKGASLNVVKALQKGHVPFKVKTGPGLLHYKMMIIDDSILVSGSANWTKAAFRYNEDCYFVLSPLNLEQQSFLKEMWETINMNAKLEKL